MPTKTHVALKSRVVIDEGAAMVGRLTDRTGHWAAPCFLLMMPTSHMTERDVYRSM